MLLKNSLGEKNGNDYIAKTLNDMVGGCDVKKYAEYKNINFKTVEEGKQQKMTQKDIKKSVSMPPRWV